MIALAALAVTIWQLSVQRRFNKLSIKPYLNLKHIWDAKGKSRSVHIINSGLGPAFITNITFKHNNENIPFSTIDDIVELADSILGSGFYSSGEVVDNNNVIEKNQKITFLTLSFHEQHDYNNARNSIFQFLKESELTIKYSSIYGQECELKTHLYGKSDHRIA